MDQREIMKDNILIAEFMGFIKSETFGKDYINPEDPSENGWQTAYDPYGRDFKYDSDWNWIMRVVEKIENIHGKTDEDLEEGLYKIEISNYYPWYTCEITASNFQFKGESVHSKINSVWVAIVKFIKWYNDEKSKI